MTATINGITVTGTPAEIAEFLRAYKKPVQGLVTTTDLPNLGSINNGGIGKAIPCTTVTAVLYYRLPSAAAASNSCKVATVKML